MEPSELADSVASLASQNSLAKALSREYRPGPSAGTEHLSESPVTAATEASSPQAPSPLAPLTRTNSNMALPRPTARSAGSGTPTGPHLGMHAYLPQHRAAFGGADDESAVPFDAVSSVATVSKGTILDRLLVWGNTFLAERRWLWFLINGILICIDFLWIVLYVVERWSVLGYKDDDWYTTRRSTPAYILTAVFAVLLVIESFFRIPHLFSRIHRNHVFSFALLFVVDVITSWPLVVSLFVPAIREVYIPGYLRVWSTRRIFADGLYNATYKASRDIRAELLKLSYTFFCILVTGTCLFRWSTNCFSPRPSKPYSFVDSLYFMVVTFSTVGYGDIVPTNEFSRICVCFIIVLAIIFVPTAISEIGKLASDSSRYSRSYSSRVKQNHIVVIGSVNYDAAALMLKELYGDIQTHDRSVVFLCTHPSSGKLTSLLQSPFLLKRTTFIEGSALVEDDLNRARVKDASCCLILAQQQLDGRVDLDSGSMAQAEIAGMDEVTFLRAWAVKLHAPQTPVHVQLIRAENKFYLDRLLPSKNIILSSQLKSMFLATSCICRGSSTLIANLLIRQSPSQAKSAISQHPQPWLKEYVQGATASVFPMPVRGFFVGRSFGDVVRLMHWKVGAIPLAVCSGVEYSVNPRPSLVLLSGDALLVLCQSQKAIDTMLALADSGAPFPTDDPPSAFVAQILQAQNENQALEALRRLSSTPAPSVKDAQRIGTANDSDSESSDSDDNGERSNSQTKGSRTSRPSAVTRSKPAPLSSSFEMLPLGRPSTKPPADSSVVSIEKQQEIESSHASHVRWSIANTHLPFEGERSKYVVGFPPSPCFGIQTPRCHLLPSDAHRLLPDCTVQCVNEQQVHKLVLVMGSLPHELFYFMCRLRGVEIPIHNLQTIVIMFPEPLSESSWSTVSMFPEVYFVKGYPFISEDLARAGAHFAQNVVILSDSAADAPGPDRESGSSMSGAQQESAYLRDSKAILATQAVACLPERLAHDARLRRFALLPRQDGATDSKLSAQSDGPLAQHHHHHHHHHYHLHRPFTITELQEIANIKFLEQTASDTQVGESSIAFQPTYAAGKGWGSFIVENLLMVSFTRPYLLPLLYALLSSAEKPAHSGTLSVRAVLPQFVDRGFGEILIYYSLLGILPIGLYCHVLPERGNTLQYVLTNPPPDYTVRGGDLLYTLEQPHHAAG